MKQQVDRRGILWMILLRLLIVTLLLVLAVIIEYSAEFVFPFLQFIYVIAAAYLISAAALVAYYWGQRLRLQAYVQILLDLALITALVYISGGASSSFHIIFVFPIIEAGLVLSSRASYLIASLSAILMGALVDGLYLGLIPYATPSQAAEQTLGSVLYTIFIAWSAFFLIAFLTNSLSGRLRKTREALAVAQKELSIRERLSEAGRISATLAHEIRNPLAAISGSVQVLQQELVLEPEQRSLMDIVLKESQRVSHNLEQFLDYALPPKQVFALINLPDIMDETLTILRGGGELDGQVEIRGNFASSGLHYFGSPGQFKQIFWNLIKNAVRAMPRGGTLDIDFSTLRKNGIQLRFADTGVGMSEEDQEHLFEPFYSRFEGGRGLGLAIVRRIVDDYDGRIDVRSALHKGTEVLITLPARGEPQH